MATLKQKRIRRQNITAIQTSLPIGSVCSLTLRARQQRRTNFPIQLSISQVDFGQFRFNVFLGDAQSISQDFGHSHGGQIESFALLLKHSNFRLKLPDISLSFPGRTLSLQRCRSGSLNSARLKKFPQHDLLPLRIELLSKWSCLNN